MKNKEVTDARMGLRALDEHDLVHVATRYAWGAHTLYGVDHQAEMKRLFAWVRFMERRATIRLERQLEELEAENTRLKQELAEAESRLEAAQREDVEPVVAHPPFTIRRTRRFPGAVKITCTCGWEREYNDFGFAQALAEQHVISAHKEDVA